MDKGNIPDVAVAGMEGEVVLLLSLSGSSSIWKSDLPLGEFGGALNPLFLGSFLALILLFNVILRVSCLFLPFSILHGSCLPYSMISSGCKYPNNRLNSLVSCSLQASNFSCPLLKVGWCFMSQRALRIMS